MAFENMDGFAKLRGFDTSFNVDSRNSLKFAGITESLVSRP